jgi:hypothetical protein
MENFANWFHVQLTSSADAFLWSIEQIPAERRWLASPHHPEEWSAARHLFHLLSYERRLALPSMHIWLGETFERDKTYKEDAAWENAEWAKGQDLPAMLSTFRQVRAEQIALLTEYDAQSWQRVLPTPGWGEVTLCWTLTKTLQHTFEHTHDVLRMGLFWDFPLKKTDDE